MFTGLVECIGRITSVSRDSSAQGVLRLSVSAPEISASIKRGESVAVSGVCLTAVDVERGGFSAQMMDETQRTTKLGDLKQGDVVNLERALQVGGRLDGHIVQGHVDEVGVVDRIESISGGTKKIWISASDKISWGIAPKGSIAIDGVSLTVIDSAKGEFSVGIIPETLSATTIGSLRAGDRVNVEIDVLARYIAQIISHSIAGGASNYNNEESVLTWEKLQNYGWS